MSLSSAALFAVAQARGATVSVLHSFHGTDGSGPLEGIIRANDGNFYGTVAYGGNSGNGAIYKITPAGKVTPFHVFASDGKEGSLPKAIIQGKDGNLYGICRGGGDDGVFYASGTFFRLKLDGTFNRLCTFDGDGKPPAFPSAIVQGSDSYFYGLSRDGGSTGLNDGTFFRITPNGRTVKELFAFHSGDGPGYRPEAQLIVGKDGNFYGVTNLGGASGGAGANGAIFRATKAGKVTRLHAFVGDEEPRSHQYPLMQTADGTLYGCSAYGGSPADLGLIYKYNIAAHKLTIVHEFTKNSVDGSYPACALVKGKDGNFYGSTLHGFPPNAFQDGNGGYFQISPTGVFKSIAKTKGQNHGPTHPIGNLVELTKGVFFGPTLGGGASGDGTVVKLVVPTTASLMNVSTRAQVMSGDESLIGNFTLAGEELSKVLVRGLGPSLPVTGALAQPTLALHQPDGSVIRNDSWTTDQSAVAETTLAPRDTRESAILTSLPAADASYTSVLASRNGAGGIGLLEVSVLSPDGAAHLGSVSTRGLVGSGDRVMIAGFTIGGGDGDAKIAIRAMGPSLARAGIRQPLADPTLKLYNSDGAVIAENDNCAESPASDPGLTPADAHEAAIVRLLAPGNYTAIVSGEDGSSGVGVVEIYNLPAD